jgi:hypothetical protein
MFLLSLLKVFLIRKQDEPTSNINTCRSVFIEQLRSLVVCNFKHDLERLFLCIVYNATSFIRAGDATNNLRSSIKTKSLILLTQVTTVFSRKQKSL